VPEISSREVERDGDVTIEITAGDQVWVELTWNGALPLVAPQIGWTLVPRHDDLLGAREEAWPWDADEQRDLAQLADALHDHRHRRAVRSEVRVRYWEFRARETSAEAAAAWGREWLARAIAGRPGPRD
jgi:hypothetical protein